MTHTLLRLADRLRELGVSRRMLLKAEDPGVGGSTVLGRDGVQDLRPLRGRPSGPILDSTAYLDAGHNQRRTTKKRSTTKTQVDRSRSYRDDPPQPVPGSAHPSAQPPVRFARPRLIFGSDADDLVTTGSRSGHPQPPP